MRKEFPGTTKGGMQASLVMQRLLLEVARESALEARDAKLAQKAQESESQPPKLNIELLQRVERLSSSITVADQATLQRILHEFVEIKSLIPAELLAILPPSIKGTLTAMMTNLESGSLNKVQGLTNEIKIALKSYKYLTPIIERMIGCYNKLCKIQIKQAPLLQSNSAFTPFEAVTPTLIDRDKAIQVLQGLSAFSAQFSNFETFLQHFHLNTVSVPEVHDPVTKFAAGLEQLQEYISKTYQSCSMEAVGQSVVFRYQLGWQPGISPPIFLHTKYRRTVIKDSYCAMTGLELVFVRDSSTNDTYLSNFRIITA